MLSTQTRSIEDFILKQLQAGPVDTSKLIAGLKTVRPETTKQGVYAALRNLRKEEVVVLRNKQAAFNIRWLKSMSGFFRNAEERYTSQDWNKGSFVSLKNGEKITYSFSDPTATDLFWWDALYVLSQSSSSSEPAFLYNPHEWFLIARHESELASMKEITKKRRWLLTSGDNTPLDRTVARNFDGDRSQYHMLSMPLFTHNNYYFNIVDDFIIEVWIDRKVAESIEQFYRTRTIHNETTAQELTKIVQGKGRSKLTISRNKTKASKLRRLLSKNFYIPKG